MSNVKKLLGKRVQEFRVKKGLTQEMLAEAVGLAERNISKIECGENFVKADTLEKIASALEVKISKLFEFEQYQDIEKIKKEVIKMISEDEKAARMAYNFLKSL